MSLAGLRTGVPLAPFTTLGLGGPARHFLPCPSIESVAAGVRLAEERGWPLAVFGGGSNVVVADEGFPGLVLKMEIGGLAFRRKGPLTLVTAGAGESWDGLVAACIERGLRGLECLSGIPGSVGAAPIQNIGAYGQELAQTLLSVTCLDRSTLKTAEIPCSECGFGYRTSHFKAADRGRLIILGVTLRLSEGAPGESRYPELAEALANLHPLADHRSALQAVRDTVLSLRRSKAMVIDPAEPESRSAGSFFLNPVLAERDFDRLQAKHGPIPSFPAPGGIKVPAAWLVEHAGFPKGYRLGGAGISTKHALALVNRGGTTADLLALASAIEEAVRLRFGIGLEREPVVIG
ncbi:MAG: UDP-N-acetylmuramate dehydrogenase [Acidobacteriota bacterium]